MTHFVIIDLTKVFQILILNKLPEIFLFAFTVMWHQLLKTQLISSQDIIESLVFHSKVRLEIYVYNFFYIPINFYQKKNFFFFFEGDSTS